MLTTLMQQRKILTKPLGTHPAKVVLKMQKENSFGDSEFKLGDSLSKFLHERDTSRDPWDLKIAYSHFLEAAKFQHPYALYNLGLLASRGDSISEKDEVTAVRYFLEVSKSDSPLRAAASYQLSKMCKTGLGVPQDSSKSLQFLTQAAQQGLLEARGGKVVASSFMFTLLDLGILLFQRGSQHEREQGRTHLNVAAEEGYAPAQFFLGLLLSGVTLPEDYNRGISLISRAAQANYPPALFHLSNLYAEGALPGFEENMLMSLYYSKKGHDAQALIQAQNESLLSQHDPIPTYPLDTTGVFDTIPQTVEDQEFRQAVRHLHGVGVPKNRRLAMECLTPLAEAGHPKACLYLGSLYHQALSTPENVAKASQYLAKASDFGEPGCYFFLGQVAEQKNQLKKAVIHYQDGLTVNCLASIVRLAQMAMNPPPGVMLDIKKVILKWKFRS